VEGAFSPQGFENDLQAEHPIVDRRFSTPFVDCTLRHDVAEVKAVRSTLSPRQLLAKRAYQAEHSCCQPFQSKVDANLELVWLVRVIRDVKSKFHAGTHRGHQNVSRVYPT
jgi:hypothetical protein